MKSKDDEPEDGPAGSQFQEAYVALVMRKLKAGQAHATLGLNRLAGGDAHEAGRGFFKGLLSLGLAPSHVCVDYGCGSLRVGQHVIRYLDPANYWGLDITDQFFAAGLPLLGPALLESKRPHLHVIDLPALDRVRAAAPDFVFSQAVAIHVPPKDLIDYLRKLLHISVAKTRIYTAFKFAEPGRRLSNLSWAHSEAEVRRLLDGLGAASELIPIERSKGDKFPGVTKAWLKIIPPQDST